MFGPRKSPETIAEHVSGQNLAKTLSRPNPIALCGGAIIGTGIHMLAGVGAERAGPMVIFAFAIAGAVCAALAYADGRPRHSLMKGRAPAA